MANAMKNIFEEFNKKLDNLNNDDSKNLKNYYDRACCFEAFYMYKDALENIDKAIEFYNDNTETNNVTKNGAIALANKNDVNNLQTDTDYRLQQQKNEKSNSNVFEKGVTWIKDAVGSLGVSIGAKISRNRNEH